VNVVAIPIHRDTVKRRAVPVGSGLFWGFVVSAVVVLWTLVPVGGLGYYTTPLAVRAYAPAHRLLKPSGPIGQTFGVFGTALMLVPFLYMVRKRFKRLSGAGTVKTWLEVHLFCGVVGPVLITLHTSFKFNGIISAAYWSMVIVMLSGFVGRYLYVRIPRSLRGTELTRAELDQAAADLRDRVAASVPPQLAAELAAFERSVVPAQDTDLSFVDLLFGELIVGRRLRRFGHELERRGIDQAERRQIVQLTGERAVLLRRTAYLQRTKTLFNLWHVFHLPLVYLLLVIAAAHIGVALYLGYVPFRW
jgi:hypothetical protein